MSRDLLAVRYEGRRACIKPPDLRVESTIANSKCDLDTATLRKGSPHILVCTKNQASYERRARQRQDDLAFVTRMS